MIIIYTQDRTFMEKDLNKAKELLISVYGEKLGTEAFNVMKSERNGATYRKYGGPLVKLVDNEIGKEINRREQQIGMMNR